MRGSLRLGTFAGVKVGIHWSIVLIAVLLTAGLAGTVLPLSADGYSSGAYLVAAVATAVLFLGSIVAHELGHSVVAQRNGIRVRGITLFALGGVAALESEPRSPGAAARIALAGPAMSVVVGAGALLGALLLEALAFPALVVAALGWLGVVNLGLAVFNMLPALPLDGGRVLQAGLWRRTGDQHVATIKAATVGRYLGTGLVLLGLWQFSQGAAGLWTAAIGVFVIATARGEEFRARYLQRRAEQQQRIDAMDPMAVFKVFGHGEAPHPHSPPRHRGDVIDVTGREAGPNGVS